MGQPVTTSGTEGATVYINGTFGSGGVVHVSRWDGSPSRYSDSEYAKACVLDRADCGASGAELPAKERYSLPIAAPGNGVGNPDAGGVHAAAGRLSQTNACPAAKKAAAKRLATAYGKIGEDVPPKVKSLAGRSEALPRDNLYRMLPEKVELRDAEGGSQTLTGHFATFNDWTEIKSVFEGNFMERISPGAFKKTFSEGRDGMRVLFQHGRDPVIGDKPLGPIETLEEDDTGAHYEVPLLDTAYNRELIPGLREGLYGASFRFQVMREDVNNDPEKSSHNPDGIPERTIKEAKVMEFGPVTFPAYASATAGLRSLTDEFNFARLADQPERLRELLEFVRGEEEKPERTAEKPDEENERDSERAMVVEDHPSCPAGLPHAVTKGATVVACHAQVSTANAHAGAMGQGYASKDAPREEAEPASPPTPTPRHRRKGDPEKGRGQYEFERRLGLLPKTKEGHSWA